MFDAQDQAYRDSVLPPGVRKRVSVEIGVSLGWERWVGDEGAIIGLDHFGASAPAGTIFEHFGFTADRVADVARKVVRDGLHGRIPTVDGGHFGGQHPTLGTGDLGRRSDRRLGPRPQLRGEHAQASDDRSRDGDDRRSINRTWANRVNETVHAARLEIVAAPGD